MWSYNYFVHFKDEDTEVQRDSVPAPCLTLTQGKGGMGTETLPLLPLLSTPLC